ncbi:hypothetical protein NO932_11565 [Pelagibacterium sp. 26DY04]|nr:hypothetical protein [Pelagibacterium sp. 26DY04]WMT85565.1 hypothetical protein NO932_11565 [Pelagibacterium sp. 26DY04]
MNIKDTIVVRKKDGSKQRIYEREFNPKLHTKVAETTAKREADKAKPSA